MKVSKSKTQYIAVNEIDDQFNLQRTENKKVEEF